MAERLLLFSRLGDGTDPSEGSEVGAVDGLRGDDPLPLADSAASLTD
jgi:hypothetical protein